MSGGGVDAFSGGLDVFDEWKMILNAMRLVWEWFRCGGFIVVFCEFGSRYILDESGHTRTRGESLKYKLRNGRQSLVCPSPLSYKWRR